jgi:hypothetical protein
MKGIVGEASSWSGSGPWLVFLRIEGTRYAVLAIEVRNAGTERSPALRMPSPPLETRSISLLTRW